MTDALIMIGLGVVGAILTPLIGIGLGVVIYVLVGSGTDRRPQSRDVATDSLDIA